MLKFLTRLRIVSVFFFIVCALQMLLPFAARAHEFWIEPQKFQAIPGQSFVADLRNGQMFKGARLPYFDHRIARFEVSFGKTLTPYSGRMGDLPGFTFAPSKPGLMVVIHQTQPDEITYDSWEKFAAFLREKDLEEPLQDHRKRGLPRTGFAETYTRYAKLLAAIGPGAGMDRDFGMEIEFTALANPYLAEEASLPVVLRYQGAPLGLTQVEVFERPPDGEVRRQLLRTDTQGMTQIPLREGHAYLLNAVIMRPVTDRGKVVWESLWASLTFARP